MKASSESIYSRGSNNPYLVGICNVFIKLLPVSIIAAFLLLGSNAATWFGIGEYSAQIAKATVLVSQVFPVLLIVFYSQVVADIKFQLKESVIISSLVSYFIICQQWGLLSGEMIVPSNTFLAICLPIVTGHIVALIRRLNIVEKEELPTVVEKSISLVFVCCLAVICIFSLSTLSKYYLVEWLPFELLVPSLDPNSLTDGIFYELARNLLWSVGINGHVVFSSYKTEIYQLTELSIQNYHEFGADIPIFTSNFFDFYAGMGGAGNTLSLVLCMLLFAKNKVYKKLAFTVLLLSIFNINEPVIYGLPIMFNPILVIPFLITPVVGLCIAYFATYTGIVPPISELMSWLTPPVISGYIGTGEQFSGAILQVVILTIGCAIYFPFFRRMEVLSNDNVLLPKIQSERFFANQDLAGFTRSNSVLPELNAKSESQKAIRQLQKSGDFVLFYQPQFDLHLKKSTSAEVLIRHQDKVGKVTPPHFIQHFSNLGLLTELDLWVMKQSLEAVTPLAEKDDFKISINVSPETFLINNFSNIVFDMINQSQLKFEQVELEITEDTLIRDEKVTFEVLQELKSFGVSIALDDFGSGYSSIGYLSKFEFDKIKVDRSLVVNSNTEKGRNLLKLTCEIASISGAKVIVEGVETQQELDLVKSLEVDVVQGFYFHKPMPLDELTTVLEVSNV